MLKITHCTRIRHFIIKNTDTESDIITIINYCKSKWFEYWFIDPLIIFNHNNNKMLCLINNWLCLQHLWINNTDTTDNIDTSSENDYKTTSGFHCLMKCPIKSNCFYEKDLQNKIARADLVHSCILILDSDRIEYFKNAWVKNRYI